ncbi:VWA domain-containing protein [Actinocatenispora rupis]|uniref:VWA domain-containing protein n=1 Tax=Actinocatenispora rupis TaxID=519421 RepID=A0A8J3N9I1_9ACTN|nr:VWA domain-containing protein [Actinocatenispora rupis]GID11329.1 VWA domain-containing protein [Actinocatenispora rupis]
MTQPAFTADVYQNQYLAAGATTVDAMVTVTATGDGTGAVPAGGAPSAAEVIMIDCSGSMGYPRSRMTEAIKATGVAIDTLRDGVLFAVVAGRSMATQVFPGNGMVAASPETRAAAKQAVGRLTPEGGTAIGSWLSLANRLFAGVDAQVKHAIMLTDGRNQHESHETLMQVLRTCEGKFTCDSRGVGGDWVADELRAVASGLLGTADGLEDPAELPAAFRSMTESAMGKAVADVRLRLWTPASSTIRFVKQVYPQVEDLTARRVDVSPRIGEYPTGSWGAESRDYHVSVQVAQGSVGEELLAARVSLVDGDTVLTQSLVLANWTDDEALSTQINDRVAHYTGQAELASAIQEGLAAREAGDEDTATAKLGRAVQLATESGHEQTAKLLNRVVDVVDAPTGTVRLRRDASNVDAELTNVRSVKTIRVKKS